MKNQNARRNGKSAARPFLFLAFPSAIIRENRPDAGGEGNAVSSENTGKRAGKARGGTVICRSCGADYAADVPNCPYCGTMNLPAAEDAYMGRLDSLRGNLENLGDLPGQKGRARMKTAYRRFLIIAVIAALVLAAGFAAHQARAREEAAREKAEYLWQREFFPRLDACYDAGDYDALRTLYEEAGDEGHAVWQYRRRAFCEYLVTLDYAERARRDAEQGCGDTVYLFVKELELYTLERVYDLGREERGLLEELRAPLLEDFAARFPMTEEELAGLRRILDRDGFMPYAEAEKFLKEKGMIP